MAYKYDEDLEFLRKLKSSDLNELVEILKGKNGEERISDFLSTNDLFKKYRFDFRRNSTLRREFHFKYI